MTHMIIDNLKNELSETAQEELKGFVSETVEQKVDKAVEKKLHKEMKKLARKITVNLILTGAVVAGAVLVWRPISSKSNENKRCRKTAASLICFLCFLGYPLIIK